VLKERLPKEVRLNATCSSGADDDRNDRVLLRVNYSIITLLVAFSALTLLVGQQEGHPSVKN